MCDLCVNLGFSVISMNKTGRFNVDTPVSHFSQKTEKVFWSSASKGKEVENRWKSEKTGGKKHIVVGLGLKGVNMRGSRQAGVVMFLLCRMSFLSSGNQKHSTSIPIAPASSLPQPLQSFSSSFISGNISLSFSTFLSVVKERLWIWIFKKNWKL